MTPSDFRHRLRALGLSLGAFARLVGIDARTVRGWGTERTGRDVQAFPRIVVLLIEAWERGGVGE